MNQNPQKSPNAENEEKILAFWNEQNIFNKTLGKESPMGEFNFFEGPPTANGRPGIHHVGARSFKDIIPRYKTMRGFSVRRKAGWDTHGLPVELQVEKSLGLKSKKEIEAYGVADFNRKCRESVWMYKDEWEKLTARMGFWLDMKSPYVTYENSYIEALWATVKRANERGHLYKDFKVLPWCTRCGTALSSHELNQPGAYKDVKDLSVFAKFKIVGVENGYFLAWTTTPWTLPGNVGLAVGPDVDYVEAKVGDEVLVLAKDLVKVLPEGFEIVAEHKGSEMIGMEYEPLYPFMNDLLPENQQAKKPNAYRVYGADFVTTTDGTGIVHTAVMYGADDFELGTKYELPKFHLVNEEGKFIEGCDTGTLKLSGRYVKETDENGKPTLAVNIIDDLTARGLLFKKENYAHSYPHCWRCDTPLIYYARTSWYFSMSKLRTQLLDANEKIKWEPDHIKEGRFGEWLDGIKDWAISRDRYWGTPLPVWSTASGKNVVIGGLSDIKKHAKRSGNAYFAMRHGFGQHMEQQVMASLDNDHYHLTEEGKKQVQLQADKLKEKGITKIISSPLLRTTETAKIVAETLGFSESDITFDDRIREYDFGEWNGKSFQEYIDYRKEHVKYYDQVLGATTLLDVKKRFGDFMYGLEESYRNETILVVTHGIFFETIPSIIEGANNERSLEILFDHFGNKRVDVAQFLELDFIPLPHNENYELDFHKPFIDAVELELDGERLVRTPEVMDVWFDSGSMPIAQDHKLGEPVNFDPRPADYIAEGVDQTRGWFYTMHAIANMLHDVPTEAYRNVICMGLLMDANGQKMSKSRGNVVEPWAMFDKYGADVVRFWFYSVNQPGDSKNFDEKSLDEVNKKVFNLLRNVVSFYEMYKPDDFPFINPFDSTNVLDQWVLANLQDLSRRLVKNLDGYKVLESARAIREFIAELSQWYVRRSRDRFKSDDVADRNFALVTLQYVLDQLSRYLAPFAPFVAEDIYQRVKIHKSEESVHLTTWHTWDEESRFAGTLARMQVVRDIVTLGLDARTKANIKVRQPLGLLTVSEDLIIPLEEYLEIVKDELNVKFVAFDGTLEKKTVVLDTNITDELRAEGDMRDMVRAVQEMRKEANLEPKDRVTVSWTDPEPTWFGTYGADLMATVGADEVIWGQAEKAVLKR